MSSSLKFLKVVFQWERSSLSFFILLVVLYHFFFYTILYEIRPSNTELFSDGVIQSVGICSPCFLKPIQHIAVICEISGAVPAAVENSWIPPDKCAVLVGHPFFPVFIWLSKRCQFLPRPLLPCWLCNHMLVFSGSTDIMLRYQTSYLWTSPMLLFSFF